MTAVFAGQGALAQEAVGGLHLTFGITERLETSENSALTTPSSGRLSASITSLNFGLTSETATQVLRFGLSGGLRFETGAAAAAPDRFDNPSLDLFYSTTGANSGLVLQANARRGLAGLALPTAADPDPTGEGMRTDASASAVLNLGTEGPLGLTLEASQAATTFGGAGTDPSDTGTVSLAATGILRFATGAEARLHASRSQYEEAAPSDLQRETTQLSIGLTQPLSPVLTLSAELGQQRVETTDNGTLDVTEGLSGNAGLTLELANGSAGVSFDQAVEAYGTRQTLAATRRIDLGSQTIAASLGATSRDGNSGDAIGSLAWTYDGAIGALSLDLSRSVASDGALDQTRTDRLALGLSREISANDRFNLSLIGARIDGTSSAPIDRTDLSASYSRDLGQDWAMNLGATITLRQEGALPRAESQLLFLSISRNFDFLP